MQTGSKYRKEILDVVLFEYRKISQAPSRHQLEERADAEKLPAEEIFNEEKKKRYKAIDLSSGNIYLIVNPAVWPQEITHELIGKNADGTEKTEEIVWVKQPPKKFVMTYAEAVKKSGAKSNEIPQQHEDY
jgi:hypothetical protein